VWHLFENAVRLSIKPKKLERHLRRSPADLVNKPRVFIF